MTDALDTDLALTARARDILIRNDRGGYTVPTHGLYPYQWNWDSAFVALGFAAFDRQRAWSEIESLFEGQWNNGMVPHILFRRNDPGYFPGPDVWQCDPAKTGASMPTSGITPIVVARVSDSFGMAFGLAGLALLYGVAVLILVGMDRRLAAIVKANHEAEQREATA